MSEKRLAVGGAIAAAIAASLCCVGPVLLAALGLGAFGAASFFAAARPYLLAGAVLLLAVGFYWTYFRRGTACAPGEACATKPVNRIGRAGLWTASIAVLAFALAPYYIGILHRLCRDDSHWQQRRQLYLRTKTQARRRSSKLLWSQLTGWIAALAKYL